VMGAISEKKKTNMHLLVVAKSRQQKW